jgi:hypothetical protein
LLEVFGRALGQWGCLFPGPEQSECEVRYWPICCEVKSEYSCARIPPVCLHDGQVLYDFASTLVLLIVSTLVLRIVSTPVFLFASTLYF